jgi:tRNA-2-methylthio-N6-dimethylallyladenosine synthase
MDVLFTGAGRHPGQLAGRSPWLQPIHADGPAHLIGQVACCVVTAAHTNSLAARIADERSGETPSQEKAAA